MSLLDMLFGRGTPMATQGSEIVGPAGEPQGGLFGGLRNASGSLLGFGMGMLSGQDQQEGFRNGLVGMQRGVLTDRQRTALREAQMEKLRMQAARKGLAAKYGMDPSLADVPDVQDAVLKDKLTPKDPLEQELLRARVAAAKREAAGGNETFGLNPVWGEDKDGNPVLLQPGNKGGMRQMPVPDGVKLSKGVDKIDAGTHFVLLDKRTGAPVGTIPKDVAGAETAKVTGKDVGEARAALTGAQTLADQMLNQIREVKEHAGRAWGVGGFAPIAGAIPGTDAYGLKRRVEQIKGGAFLDSIKRMQGFGALSNQEGEAATRAATRLDTATSQAEFDAALDELVGYINSGMNNLRQKAAGGAGGGNAGTATNGVPWRVK